MVRPRMPPARIVRLRVPQGPERGGFACRRHVAARVSNQPNTLSCMNPAVRSHSSQQAQESLRERKKRMTREAIFTAAEELFNERGFDAVTVAEIADTANISVK